jgi:hypothetical protein
MSAFSFARRLVRANQGDEKVAGKIKGELAQYREMAASRSSVPTSTRRRSACSRAVRA